MQPDTNAVDWSQKIFDLVRAGLSEQRIGLRIGMSRQGVNDLKSGKMKDPRYSPGLKLLSLHAVYQREGWLHDRKETSKLGAVLECRHTSACDPIIGGPLQSATRG